MPDDEFAVTFCLVLFEQENRAIAVDTDWYEVWGSWEMERQAIQSELKRLEALSPSSKFKDYYEAQVAKTEFYRDYAEAQPAEKSSKTATWRDVMRDPESRTAFEEIFAEIQRTKQELSGEALSTLALYNCSWREEVNDWTASSTLNPQPSKARESRFTHPLGPEGFLGLTEYSPTGHDGASHAGEPVLRMGRCRRCRKY